MKCNIRTTNHECTGVASQRACVTTAHDPCRSRTKQKDPVRSTPMTDEMISKRSQDGAV